MESKWDLCADLEPRRCTVGFHDFDKLDGMFTSNEIGVVNVAWMLDSMFA